jgi:hypothetical protein
MTYKLQTGSSRYGSLTSLFTPLHITELNEAKLIKPVIGGILPKLARSMQSSNEVTLQLVVLVEGQNWRELITTATGMAAWVAGAPSITSITAIAAGGNSEE